MKRVLANKRGVAMETAIITMLVILGLCMILLVIAELTGARNARTVQMANERITADRIGEDFYRAHKMNTDFYADRYVFAYTCTVETLDEDTERLLVYYNAKYSTPILCVDVRGTGDDTTVLRWSYKYSGATE